MEVPVATGYVLILIGVECLNGWLQIPNLFEKIHILSLKVLFFLLVLEEFGRGFGLAKADGDTLDLLFPPLELQEFVFGDGLDGLLVLLILFVLVLLEELVLDH